MIIIDPESVPAETVTMEGVKGTKIQWLIDNTIAPNFAMRRFIIEPDGIIPLHNHPYEHEVYILLGKGVGVASDGERELKQGDVIFVPPDEQHGWKNTGNGPLVLLCFIPISQ